MMLLLLFATQQKNPQSWHYLKPSCLCLAVNGSLRSDIAFTNLDSV